MPTLKPEEKRRARELRRQGMPTKRIAAELSVSPASAFAWTRDIPITRTQVERNYAYMRDPLLIAGRAATWREKSRRRRLAFQAEGRLRAREGDPLHQAGCMLYWAEGAKGRNQAKLANSDPNLVRFYVRFLRACFGIEDGAMRLRLNVCTTNGLGIDEIERWWTDLLELSSTCWGTHSVNHLPTSSSGRKVNRLPYGVCTVSVSFTRLVQHIYGAIQEYGGFDEPRWVDAPTGRRLAAVRPTRSAHHPAGSPRP